MSAQLSPVLTVTHERTRVDEPHDQSGCALEGEGRGLTHRPGTNCVPCTLWRRQGRADPFPFSLLNE